MKPPKSLKGKAAKGFASPGRKKTGGKPAFAKKLKRRTVPELLVFAPAAVFGFEGCIFNGQLDSDGCTKSHQDFCKDELPHPSPDEKGFVTHHPRRQQGPDNKIAVNVSNGFWRIIMI